MFAYTNLNGRYYVIRIRTALVSQCMWYMGLIQKRSTFFTDIVTVTVFKKYCGLGGALCGF